MFLPLYQSTSSKYASVLKLQTCTTGGWADLDLLDIFGHHLRHILSKRRQLVVRDGVFGPDSGCMKDRGDDYNDWTFILLCRWWRKKFLLQGRLTSGLSCGALQPALLLQEAGSPPNWNTSQHQHLDPHFIFSKLLITFLHNPLK